DQPRTTLPAAGRDPGRWPARRQQPFRPQAERQRRRNQQITSGKSRDHGYPLPACCCTHSYSARLYMDNNYFVPPGISDGYRAAHTGEEKSVSSAALSIAPAADPSSDDSSLVQSQPSIPSSVAQPQGIQP